MQESQLLWYGVSSIATIVSRGEIEEIDRLRIPQELCIVLVRLKPAGYPKCTLMTRQQMVFQAVFC
jgi:hypothetical protein